MSQKRAFHPFLFAAFPILYLARVNLWSITIDEVLPSFDVALGVVVVMYAAGRKTWGDGRRAAICLSIWTLLFFSYGHVWADASGKKIAGFEIGRDAILLPLWTAIAVAGVVFALRVKSLGTATQILNAIAIVLVLTTAVPVALHLVASRPAQALPAGVSLDLEPAAANTSRPDIYYLVFDRYAGPQTLRSHFNYSNSRFVEFLQRRGFALPCSSYANYENTTKSLAASLNLDYVDWISDRVGRESSSLVPFYSAIRHNAVKRYLKSSGYKIVHIGSWFDPTNSDPEADQNFRLDAPSGFTRALYTSSALWPAARNGLIGSVHIGREELHRSVALRQLELLRSAPSLRGPKFVFAHVLMPHPPYVFTADGSLQTHEKRIDLRHAGGSPYLEQLKFLNARLERIINGIVTSNRKRPPVVIIQADEGPMLTDIGFRHDVGPDYAPGKALAIKYHIMNALHLPGVPPQRIPDSISPVNIFRLVFNTYFKTSLEMLPNRAYVSSATKPHQTLNITERLRGALNGGSCSLSQQAAPVRPAE
ncbi:MAG TPA: hypothetical protein VFA34_03775 [Actinomycetota bacterium]|nr:hypothetical protein [Actinomycetota bacterium]